MALGWYKRDRLTPGNPVISVTEAQWRAFAAQYVPDVDKMEFSVMTADTNWITTPYMDLWLSNTGTFNPTLGTNANQVATHRRGDVNTPGSRAN